MEKQVHNSIVTLQKVVNKPPPTKIVSQRPSISRNGSFFVSPKQPATFSVKSTPVPLPLQKNLTDQNFSVTRARAYAGARKDEGGLRRVLDAALSGGDVHVASVVPASLLSRIVAAALLPAMLIMPLVPAYANEAPLSLRVASDVAAFVEGGAALAVASPSDTTTPVADNTLSSQPEEVQVSSVDMNAPSLNSMNPSSSDETPSDPATPSLAETEQLVATSDSSTATPVDQTETGVVAGAVDNTPEVAPSGSSEIVPSTSSSQLSSTTASSTADVGATEAVSSTEEVVADISVIDTPSPEVAEDLSIVRARIRDELRNEVKTEVRKEVEQEVYRGCKNLDGMGYYCIPDAKSFGAPVISNERAISAVVQQDAFDGDKEIFITLGDSTMQLTHNSDDDVFPVLDPAGDTLVWQTLVAGRWQISYAHMNDTGVPKVHQLTNGENNFNPKVYRGKIVWQAWIDGNWEIVVATPAREFIPEDAQTAEHRLLGVGGDFELRRVTANRAPDMFPTISDGTVTWQAIDGGVWQVFAYDLQAGEVKRISKPGVKSESPSLALVWNEETESGDMKLVGADVHSGAQFDFTALARKLADRSKKQPDTPLTTTEIIVVQPGATRVEEKIDTPVI